MADNDHLPQPPHPAANGGPDRPQPGAPRMESRRIPPHGDVSPRGDRVWPRPSMTAKVLVYGGTALGVAAATAAGVLAVRKVADLVSGNDALDRKAERAAEQAAEQARAQVYAAARAPRFAIPAAPAPDREEMRARARAKMREDAIARRRLREKTRMPPPSGGARAARAAQPPRRRGLLDEIESNARRMTRTIDDVVGSVGAAVAGFCRVAGQADSVMREFGGAADQLRSFFGGGHAPRDDARDDARNDARRPRAADEPFRRAPRRDDGDDAGNEPRPRRR